MGAPGRATKPRFVALAFYALGEREAESKRWVLDYYPPERAETVDRRVLRTPAAIADAIRDYRDLKL